MADNKTKGTGERQKKPNIFVRIGRWFKSVFSELRKVTWPTFGKVVKQTGTVLAVVGVFFVVLFLFDLLLGWAYDGLISGLSSQIGNLLSAGFFKG